MTTTEPRAAAAARIGAGLGQQKRAELLGLLRGCFVRAEPWLQAGRYIAAVTGGLAKRNGWTIAEYAGDRSPQRTQRLLNRAVWDAFTAMGCVGKVANGITTVHLSYVRERTGHAADRRPAVDPARAHQRPGGAAGHGPAG